MHHIMDAGSRVDRECPPDGAPVAELYRALEGALLEALAGAGRGDARLRAIARAEMLVIHLTTALDVRTGTELVRRLGALYRYMSAELGQLRRTPDDERLEELLDLAVTLRSSVHPPAKVG